MPDALELINGTVIAHGETAALIRGPSGSGKSDLALQCLVHASNPLVPGPVHLVGDDYVEVTRDDAGVLCARAPKTLAGKLEVRGLGILDVKTISMARLILIVDLVEREKVMRLPDPVPFEKIHGVRLPVLKLHAFDNSSASKLLLTLARNLAPLKDT